MSSNASSGVEEEEDEEPANLLRQHFDTLTVETDGNGLFSKQPTQKSLFESTDMSKQFTV